MFQNAGFEIVECRPKKPTDADLAVLKSLLIDNKFENSLEDLGVKTLWLVAIKPQNA